MRATREPAGAGGGGFRGVTVRLGAALAVGRAAPPQAKALEPVSARPIVSWWISAVPSYVRTDSRLAAWRMTGYSSVTPLAPRTVTRAASDLQRFTGAVELTEAYLLGREAPLLLEPSQVVREQ